MSRLEELIQKYCPNGVEYRKISEIYSRLKGTPITAAKMKEIASSDGKIRIFAGGKTVINAHESTIPNANITSVPAVLVQSRGIIDFIYYDQPFTFKNEMWAYTSDNPVMVKFLYYVLKNNQRYFIDASSGMGSMPQISLPVTEDFLIPLPPLPVQEEIVRILDKFTTLEAELEVELEARKKQYEYYRDSLYTFFDSVSHITLSDICDVRDGTHDSPKKTNKGKLLVTSKNIKNGTVDLTTAYFISEDDFYAVNKRSKVDKWNVIISMIGTVGEVALITSPPDYAIKNIGLIKSEDELTARYIWHYLKSKQAKNYITDNISKGSQSFLSLGKLRQLPIPLPPLAEQERIVSILDRFDALVNDITQGLPAEIEARRKQYEYYRNQLLTFKEATP